MNTFTDLHVALCGARPRRRGRLGYLLTLIDPSMPEVWNSVAEELSLWTSCMGSIHSYVGGRPGSSRSST